MAKGCLPGMRARVVSHIGQLTRPMPHPILPPVGETYSQLMNRFFNKPSIDDAVRVKRDMDSSLAQFASLDKRPRLSH